MGRKRKRHYKVEAAFSPSVQVICPECWSRPSIDGRQREDAKPRSQGWSVALTAKTVKVKRVAEPVAEIKYPCSNPECLAHIVLQFVFSLVGSKESYGPWLKKQMLTGEKAAEYETGHTDKEGVWHSTTAPEPEPPAPKVKRSAPKAVKKGAKKAPKKEKAPPKRRSRKGK